MLRLRSYCPIHIYSFYVQNTLNLAQNIKSQFGANSSENNYYVKVDRSSKRPVVKRHKHLARISTRPKMQDDTFKQHEASEADTFMDRSLLAGFDGSSPIT